MHKISSSTKKVIASFLAIAVLGGVFYGGLYLGAQKKVILITNSRELIDADFSLFWEAVQTIKEKYVNIDKIEDEELLYGAIQGVADSLDDPYSVFFNPSDAQKFEQDINGAFGGIGAEIGIRNNQLIIIAPLKNNPAEIAGLKAGDKILKVDDTITTDITLDEAVKIIRGEPGSEVRLLILRDGWKETKEFKITRRIVVIPTLDWEMKEGSIAYIQLYNFNSAAPQLFYRAVFAALLAGAKGVVLDLRNNPGGFLETATEISGWFLNRGAVVVRERFRSDREEVLRADGNGALKQIPVVVLINNGSASASEILAGALRDNRGIKLIGEKTFGKGTVQEIASLSDGSTLKISIAEWLTPNGHKINSKGLEPDIEVKLTDEDIEAKRDPQFAKAMEVLRSEISKGLSNESSTP